MIGGKKTPGDRLRISAEAYNSFIDAATAERDSRHSGGALISTIRKTQTLIKVKNSTGANRSAYQIVGLDEVLNFSGINYEDMKKGPVFNVVTPSDTYHKKRFAILQEAIPSGEIGIACVNGWSFVDLLPSGTITDQYAAIIDGDYYLQQDPSSGGADVMWVYNGVGNPTLPAIVRVPSTRLVSGGVGARVYHSSNQTVTPSGLVLDFNSEDYDDDSFHSGSAVKKLTVSTGGRYTFGAQIEINLPSTDTNAFLSVRHTGSAEVCKCSGHQGGNGGLLNLNCNMVMDLLGGDYLEVLVTHDDPMGNATVNSTSGTSPYFWIQRV